MKISVKQKVFEKLVDKAKGGVSNRDITPAFKNFKLTCRIDRLEIWATDGNVLEVATALVDGDNVVCESEGDFLIDAEEFGDLVKSFRSTDTIIISDEETEEDSVRIRCGKFDSRYRRRVEEEEEILQFVTPEEYRLGKETIEIGFPVERSLERVAFAKVKVDMNVRQFDLSGVYIRFKKEGEGVEVTVRASDRNRVASLEGRLCLGEETKRLMFLDGDREEVAIYLSDKIVSEAVRLKVSTLILSKDLGSVCLRDGSIALYTRVEEFTFPDLDETVTFGEEGKMVLKVNREEFGRVMERAELLVPEATDLHHVDINLDSQIEEEKSFTVSKRAEKSSFVDIVELESVEGSGSTDKLTVNPDHLVDFLKVTKAKEVKIIVPENKGQLFVKVDGDRIFENQKYVYIVSLVS